MRELQQAVREGRATPLGNLDEDPKARALALVVQGDGVAAGLRAYATIKMMALGAREAGAIIRAVELEKQCETIYKQLPAGARW